MSLNGNPTPGGMPSWALPGVVIALVLAAGIGFAGYEIGHKPAAAARATATPAPTATAPAFPTPTLGAAPTVSPKPTPTPSAKPTAFPTSVLLPTPTSAATPTPTPTPGNPTVTDPQIIRSRGYKPGQSAWMSDGHGGRIYAWIGTCASSGDGYCQKVFFFHGTSFLGTDTAKPSRSIIVVIAEGNLSNGISVQYANYASTDPMCCPTGQPVTIVYSWNGSRIVGSGTPPGQ